MRVFPSALILLGLIISCIISTSDARRKRIRRKPKSSLPPIMKFTYTQSNLVLVTDMKVYLFFYGNWSEPKKAVVYDFINGLDSSPLWNVVKEYYYQSRNQKQFFVNGKITIGGVSSVTTGISKKLVGEDIPNIIKEQIEANNWDIDPTASYLFLFPDDIEELGIYEITGQVYCLDYCGYHGHIDIPIGTSIYYGVAGYPRNCDECKPRLIYDASPNNDTALDSMLSVIFHEIAEIATDPNVAFGEFATAWVDSTGYELADKCNMYYYDESKPGQILPKTPWGATYNMGWLNRKFLIQSMYSEKKDKCILSH